MSSVFEKKEPRRRNIVPPPGECLGVGWGYFRPFS